MGRLKTQIGVQKFMKIVKIWSLVVGFIVWPINQAQAYIDPVGGSILLQILLGGVAGLVLLLKFYWHRFLSILGIRKEEIDDSPVEPTVKMETPTESTYTKENNDKTKGEEMSSS